jgi:hypothetical protein
MIDTEQMEFVIRAGLNSTTPARFDDVGATIRENPIACGDVSIGDAPRSRPARCDFAGVFLSRTRDTFEFATFGDRDLRGHV